MLEVKQIFITYPGKILPIEGKIPYEKIRTDDFAAKFVTNDDSVSFFRPSLVNARRFWLDISLDAMDYVGNSDYWRRKESGLVERA